MRVAPFFVLAVVLAGCQPQPQPDVKPQPQSEVKPATPERQQPAVAKGKVVDVEIIGATHPKLVDACQTLNKPVNTIYVDTNSRQVFHCVAKDLLQHTDHGPGNVLSPADVPLSAGESVRWFSATHTFVVVSVVKGKQPPQSPSAPDLPFPLAAAIFSETPTKDTTSPPLPDLAGEVVQRYKVTFNITGVGIVDPDLICSM